MIKVITSSGFGRVNTIPTNPDEVIRVELEQDDPLGKTQRLPHDEVYQFGDYFVIRVLSPKGAEVISNILPFAELDDAEAFYSDIVTGGETKFLLDLATGEFKVMRQLGLLANRFMHIQPYMDCLAPEPSAKLSDDDDSLDSAISRFDAWEKTCAGTSSGIFVPTLLDTDEKKIIRFAIAVTACRGVVFSKKF